MSGSPTSRRWHSPNAIAYRAVVRRLADHPFLAGLCIVAGFSVLVRLLPADLATPARVRALGLVVFAGTMLLLFGRGLDRDDAFMYFLGGVVGLLVSFALTLST